MQYADHTRIMSNIPSNKTGVSKTSGANEPSHYMFKIESYSLLSKAGIKKFDSDTFEAADHKWRLELYPNGNKEEKVDDHISLYLVIVDAASLPKGWNVHVYFKFFIYDHIRDNYLTIQGADGKRRKFDAEKTVWGFPKLISLDSFSDAAKGYLSKDSCIFGAEVFAAPKYVQKDQCLSMFKPPVTSNTYTWTISNFSAITDESLYSDDFKVGRIKWRMLIYPKGVNSGENTHLSVFLEVYNASSLQDNWRLYAKFKLRIKNQIGSTDTDEETETGFWFCKSTLDWGFSSMLSLSDLKDTAKGFLVNDTLMVEAEISIMGMVTNFI